MDLNIEELKSSISENWALTQNEYKSDCLDERGWECLFTVSNGYVGIKGSVELATRYRDPRSFFAGVFDKPDTGEKKKVFGLELYNKAITPAFAQAPVFRNIEILKNGRSLDFINSRVVNFCRTFDLQNNAMISEYVLEDDQKALTSIKTLFFISKPDCNYCAQLVDIKPINYSAELVIKFLNSQNTGADCLPRIRDYVCPTNLVKAYNCDGIASMLSEVSEMKTQIQLASKTSGPCKSFIEVFDNGILEGFNIEAKEGTTYSFVKQVCFVTSLDKLEGKSAAALLKEKLRDPAATHFKAHVDFWRNAWACSDVLIEGDKDIQLGTRWCIANLIQLGERHGHDVSIGATGLHGNGYFGHVFWETELWLAPYYMATDPVVAKNLLLYRYSRLGAARQNASLAGFKGAKFPWTSTHTGLDVTPPDWAKNSKREVHISGAVAYGFWNYLQWTGDQEFFNKYGIEVIVETAKFWASYATKGPDGLYHLEDIVGPDEYQIHADDNYYTVCLARWNMIEAVQSMDSISRQAPDLFNRIAERTEWNETLKSELLKISGAIALPRTRDGVCEQHRGFFDQPDVPGVKVGSSGVNLPKDYSYDGCSQLSKQADVIMMHYIFPDQFSQEIQSASYDYYRARCLHGSSLSPSIYCIMGQRLGRLEHSYEDFRLTALQDLKNLHLDKNLSDGIHAGCAAGTWLAAAYGFGGVSIAQSHLSINSVLPKAIKSLQFGFKYHSRFIKVRADHEQVRVSLVGEPLKINLCGDNVELDQKHEHVKTLEKISVSMPGLKGVIFDLDGVIVDTAKYHYQAWKKIADQENIPFNEAINERLKGVSRIDSLNIILEKATRDYSLSDRQALAEKKNSLYIELLLQLTPSDFAEDIKELIELLRRSGIKTAVCSASKNTDIVIERLNIRSLFDVIVSGKDVTMSKPNPQGFLLAAQKLTLEPETCLVVEDAAAGIDAAKNANMKSIGIGSSLYKADAVLPSMRYLTWKVIEKLYPK